MDEVFTFSHFSMVFICKTNLWRKTSDLCRWAYSLPILFIFSTHLCFLPFSKTQTLCSNLTHIHKCLQRVPKTLPYIRVLRRDGHIKAIALVTEANISQPGLTKWPVLCCYRWNSWPYPKSALRPSYRDLYFPSYFHSWTLAWLCYRKTLKCPWEKRQQ